MKSFKHKLYLFLGLSLLGLNSCVDEVLTPDNSFQVDLPEGMEEGLTISFQISLDPMGGAAARSRSTSEELTEIEDFIDLEKLRILFFTCTDVTDETGQSDHFLFESRSRWVAPLDKSSAASSKLWQVTTPVFTYGNEDTYNWDNVRELLTTKPFKVVVLANRPDSIRYGDFDGLYVGDENQQSEFWYGNRGPYWGPADSYADNKSDRTSAGKEVPHINNLHHCQWDPVYANKNRIENKPKEPKNNNGVNVYDMILANPDQDFMNESKNWMGAVSSWTVKDKKDDKNYYYHPDKSQGIPMYGCQIFDHINADDWKVGTPFNVSETQTGQASYNGKTVSLLRSLVRIDLEIPRWMGGKSVEVKDPQLLYSNVMARCEPLDVSTPTDQIWSDENCDTYPFPSGSHYGKGGLCEWYLLQQHEPLINGDYGEISAGQNVDVSGVRETINKRMAWFYGAWKDWWDFNGKITAADCGDGPYPHIFNVCVQRNANAYLDRVKVPDDPDFHHFVIYTGERNINDPSNFRNLNVVGSEICFFQFGISFDGSAEKIYQLAIADYTNNELIKKYRSAGTNLKGSTADFYRMKMINDNNPSYWNWVLLRNHIYRFRILSIDNNVDDNGNDVIVIDTENRYSPTISYN